MHVGGGQPPGEHGAPGGGGHRVRPDLPGPVSRLEAWRTGHGWPHTWVSSGSTTYHDDWNWTLHAEDPDSGGYAGPVPGYSYYLKKDGRVFLTYATRQRGTEAILPVAHIMDRAVYGRQQDVEDSPSGWPQYPTYG